ncbi:gem-associated protein 5-like isoform X1 [Branchiostoma floridae x Branchiostoma japonicum]
MARSMNNVRDGVVMLPPSPNWFFGGVADATKGGVFAFCAKNSVYLLDVKRTIPCVTGCLPCACARVTGCVFSLKPGQERLCATSGDNGVVQVWDTDSLTCLHTQGQHRSPVTAVLWSPAEETTIVSADQKGFIVKWHYQTGDVQTFCPDPKGHIVSLACSSHQPCLLAAGLKSGTVVVLDMRGEGQVVCSLQGHMDEVQSVVWMAADDEDDNRTHTDESMEDKGHGQLLASGSKDGTIRVWNTTSASCAYTLKLPSKPLGYRGRGGGEDGGRRLWVALCWRKEQPHQIISSSHGGDILLWDLRNQKWQALDHSGGTGHSRVVFSITAVQNHIITTSMDRQIILWDLSRVKPQWSLPTSGGFVYALAFSPLTTGQLAIGVGDGMVRIWNTQSGSPFDCLGFWQGTKGKVTALSWHPTKEGTLAFGTDDGSVGLYDVLHTKHATMSSTSHKKTVYSLSWGPAAAVSGVSTNLALYSCGGDGEIYQHSFNKTQQLAVCISDIIKTTNQIKHKLPPATEIAWREDGQFVAIGNEDGSVEVMASHNLRRICIIRTHHRPINKLCWHPMLPDAPALYSYWLASASNQSDVHVHNLLAVIGADTQPAVPLVFSEPFRQAEGHKAKVVDLSWSPHRPGWLVSASYDNTAQVWDMTKDKAVSNYRGHQGRVLSVQWCPTDVDMVYSGGDDFSVQSWKISQQEHKEPPIDHKPPGRKPKSKGKAKNRMTEPHKQVAQDLRQPELTRSQEQVGTGPSRDGALSQEDMGGTMGTSLQSEDQLRLLEEKRAQLLRRQKAEDCTSGVPQLSLCEEDIASADSEGQEATGQLKSPTSQRSLMEDVMPVQRTRENAVPIVASAAEGRDPRFNRKKKKGRSLFPLSANMDNRAKCHLQQDCLALTDLTYERAAGDLAAGSGDLAGLGLFFDRRSLYKTFKEESLNHLQNGHLDHSLQLAIWRGDIVGALQMARQHGQLTDWLVAMAPLAGHDVWLQTVEDYSEQLCAQDQHYKAVTFLLACHKVHEAIDLLKNNKMFREAVALAKVRLPPHDPAVLEVYDAWATELQKDHYEQAAKCYLAMQQPCDAAAVLARRGDLETLQVAAKIAAAAGSEDQLSSVACRYAHECQVQCKWREGQDLLRNHKQLQVHRLNLCLHEVLVHGLYDIGCLSEGWAQAIVPYSWGELGSPVFLPEFLQYTGESDPLCPWSPYLLQGQCFLGYVVQVWSQYCGLDLTTGNTPQLCQQLTATLTGGSKPANAAKLLCMVSCQVTTGLLYLVGGDVHEAVTHFVAAVHLIHDRGQYYIMKGLLQMLLPQGSFSLRQLDTLTGEKCFMAKVTVQGNCTSLQHILSCLSAFYHVATLYELWWSGPHQAVQMVDSGDGYLVSSATDQPQKCSTDGSYTMKAAASTPEENNTFPATDQMYSVFIQQLQAISAAVLIPDVARRYALEERLAEMESTLHGAAANQRQSRLSKNTSTCNTVQTDGNYTCSTVQADGNNTCSTVQADGNNTCSTVQADGNNTCSTVQADGNNTCSTVQADGNNTCSTVQADGNNTCSTVQADGNNTCSTVQADGNNTCSTVQTGGNNTCSTVQADGNNTYSTVQADGNNTCSTVQADGNNTCSTVQADGNNTCSTVQADGNNTCSTVQADGNNTCSTVQTGGNNTCSTVQADGNNTYSTVQADGNNTCSTVQADGNNTCSTVQADGNNTCSTVQADGNNTCSTVQTGGNNTCSTVQADGNNTCSTVQADGNNTCSTVQADGNNTCSTVQADGNNTCSTVQADGNNTCSTVQTDGNYTCSTVQADGNNTCSTVQADGNNTCSTVQADGNNTCSTVQADGNNTCSTVQTDGNNTCSTVQTDGLQTGPSRKNNAEDEEWINRGSLNGNSQMMAGLGVQQLETCQDVNQSTQLSHLKDQLSTIPQGYRILPFPEPVELAMTLVYLCCHWPQNQDIMAAVGHAVISWGLTHSHKSSQHQYFTRWFNKMST